HRAGHVEDIRPRAIVPGCEVMQLEASLKYLVVLLRLALLRRETGEDDARALRLAQVRHVHSRLAVFQEKATEAGNRLRQRLVIRALLHDQPRRSQVRRIRGRVGLDTVAGRQRERGEEKHTGDYRLL